MLTLWEFLRMFCCLHMWNIHFCFVIEYLAYNIFTLYKFIYLFHIIFQIIRQQPGPSLAYFSSSFFFFYLDACMIFFFQIWCSKFFFSQEYIRFLSIFINFVSEILSPFRCADCILHIRDILYIWLWLLLNFI